MERLQKFYFQAVDNDNRKVSGSIFAEDEDSAREKLKKQGLALFSIEEFSIEKSQNKTGLDGFEFEGTNSEGKHVSGKIEAINAYEAYKKLRSEYEFELTSLVDDRLSFEEKDRIKESGISNEFKELYEEESAGLKDKKKKKKKVEVVSLSQKDETELAIYRDEITVLSKEIRELLEKNEKFLKRSKKREIIQRIDLIERLKRSNAIDHLKNLTQKLIKQLNDDEIFLKEEKLTSEEEIKELNEIKGNFTEYYKGKKSTLAAKIYKLNSAFNIDPNKFVANVSRARPLTQFGRILYWSIVSLFCMMTILWINNGIYIVMLEQEKSAEALYIFKSILLWLLTAVSLINMMVFAPMIFSQRTFSIKARSIYFGIAIILTIATIFLLPKFF